MVSKQGQFDEIPASQEDDERTRRPVTSLARCPRQEPARFVARQRRIPKADQFHREWTQRSKPLHADGDCRGTRYSVAGSQYPVVGGRLRPHFLRWPRGPPRNKKRAGRPETHVAAPRAVSRPGDGPILERAH